MSISATNSENQETNQDFVQVTPQLLDSTKQAQARANIGALAKEDVSNLIQHVELNADKNLQLKFADGSVQVISLSELLLNRLQLKGVVDTYADLASIANPKPNDAYQVAADNLVYIYTMSGFQAEGKGFDISLDPSGKVEAGDNRAVSGNEVFEAVNNPVGKVESGDNRPVSGGEVFKKLPEYTKSKNLFNEEEIQYDKYVSNNGFIMTGQDWDCSSLIPVEQGNYYLSGQKDRHGVGFYNESGVPVRYAAINVGLVSVQEGEYFVAFNLKSNITGGYSNIQFERGSSATEYEPYAERIIKKTSVEGLELTEQRSIESKEITEIFEKHSNSTNLINPAKVLHKTLLISGGGTATGTTVSDQYNTTEFIKVEPNTTYTGLRLDSSNIFRYTAFYSAPNVESFLSQITTAHSSFTTPTNGNYVRTSIFNENHGPTLVGDMTQVGLFKGNEPQWSYFGEYLIIKRPIATEAKPDESVATIADIKNITSKTETETGKISYALSGGNLNVMSDIGTLSGRVNEKRGFEGNDMFNFSSSTIKGVTVGSSDDVAPMHILNFTMGANHGYSHVIATIPAHGLTNIDIGTEFEKGGIKYYPLRIIDENTVAFLSENSGTMANPAFTTLSTGTITRGAETFTITDRSNAQLYPSIGELNKYIFVNNEVKEVDENEQGNTNKLEVVENYVIYDPTTVLNNTIARAGQPQEPTMIGEGNVRVNNIYRFVNNACLVFANVQFLKEIAFADIMVTQAVRISPSNATQYYVPNSNPLNGSVDLRKPTVIAWSSSIPTTHVINANQPDPLNPPNRVIQYNGNVGFMLCYILTRGQGKNIHEYTNRTFEIRNNSGKVYPHPVEGTKVGSVTDVGDAYSVAMARVYTDLNKTRIGNRLSIFQFEVDDEIHVYIDYSGSMIDKVNLEDFSLNGKKIEVLESSNAVLKTNIYNNGLIINANYVEGETCYIVLILK